MAAAPPRSRRRWRAGALASGTANRSTFVQNLWNVAQQSGEYRYYQECVYLLGLLATAGKFAYAF